MELLNDMALFIEVANVMSFRRAADAEYSHESNHIAALESNQRFAFQSSHLPRR